MNKKNSIITLQLLLLLLIINFSKSISNLYDQMKTDVVNLNDRNFVAQISKLRTTGGVSIVHYYSGDDGQSSSLKSSVEKFAQ